MLESLLLSTRRRCALLMLVLLFAGCASDNSADSDAGTGEAHVPAESTVDDEPYKNVNVMGFEELRKRPDVVVLDVRTPEEISDGKIPGAQEINYQDDDFSEKISGLDKNKTYAVYCAAGGRSSRTAQMMADQGFNNVYNLEGGFTAWSEAMIEHQ